jgi:DNA repair exonuclease SbcCD nuclease subunit
MQFTFIHAADLHIDSPLAGLGCKDAVVAARFARAGRRAVEALIDEAIAAKAAFLLICGDIFDGDWKDVTTGLFFVRELGRLERAGIQTFIIKGNHDAESLMSKSLPYPDGARIFSTRGAHSFEIESLRVALHGRSFPQRLVDPNFVASYPARREGWFNIGLLHTALDGSRGHESYAPCAPEDLKRFGYDYWALGHVHAAEEISRDPWIVYPGNIQGRSVRETGPKGAMRVAVADGRVVEAEFVALDAARWAGASIDVSGCQDEAEALARIEARLREEHALAEGRPLAARVSLVGATPLHARLVTRRESIEADARAIGFRVADDLWVEQLKIATRAPPRRAEASFEADALDVEALVGEAAADPEFSRALEELVARVGDKLPRDLREQLPREAEALKLLANEARDRLIGEIADSQSGA